jgi:WD40 repeat protein
VIRQLEPKGNFWTAFTASPDGRLALAAWRSETGTDVVLTDTTSGEDIWRTSFDEYFEAVVFSPDGQMALLGEGGEGHPSDVILIDTNTGAEIRRFSGHPQGITALSYSPDGKRAVSAGYGGVMILWDIATGQEIHRLADHSTGDWTLWTFVAFTPDGHSIVGSLWYEPIVQFDATTGQEVRQFQGQDNGAGNMAFSGAGRLAYSGSEDQTTILWDTATATVLGLYRHSGPVAGVDITLDGRFGIAGADDTQLRELTTGEVMRRYEPFMSMSMFAPDNRTVLAGAWLGSIELWRIDQTLDELLAWTHANRYIPDLTCEQRELYRLEPLCEPGSE